MVDDAGIAVCIGGLRMRGVGLLGCLLDWWIGTGGEGKVVWVDIDGTVWWVRWRRAMVEKMRDGQWSWRVGGVYDGGGEGLRILWGFGHGRKGEMDGDDGDGGVAWGGTIKQQKGRRAVERWIEIFFTLGIISLCDDK